MKEYLKGRRCYLGGPIEMADPKDDWRPPVKERLAKEIGLKVFDPNEDPKQSLAQRITECKEQGKWDELTEIVHHFVHVDLTIVDRADFIIQHLPFKVPTTGTVHEIINSNDRKKPTLLVCPQGKGKIPAWYFGFIDHRHMFGSWDELLDYLGQVTRGEHVNDRRWYFVHHYHDLAWIN